MLGSSSLDHDWDEGNVTNAWRWNGDKIWVLYARLYFPQMCNMKTQAMNSRDITKTGTGPLQRTNVGWGLRFGWSFLYKLTLWFLENRPNRTSTFLRSWCPQLDLQLWLSWLSSFASRFHRRHHLRTEEKLLLLGFLRPRSLHLQQDQAGNEAISRRRANKLTYGLTMVRSDQVLRTKQESIPEFSWWQLNESEWHHLQSDHVLRSWSLCNFHI